MGTQKKCGKVTEKRLRKFDKNLGVLLEKMRENDLLILTADHGNDPTHTGTDHTREMVPFFAYSPSMEDTENCRIQIHLQ